MGTDEQDKFQRAAQRFVEDLQTFPVDADPIVRRRGELHFNLGIAIQAAAQAKADLLRAAASKEGSTGFGLHSSFRTTERVATDLLTHLIEWEAEQL